MSFHLPVRREEPFFCMCDDCCRQRPEVSVRDARGKKTTRTRADIAAAAKRDLYARLVYSRFERHALPAEQL